MIVINPPWKLAAEIAIIAPALVNLLGRETGGGYVLEDLAADATHARF